jgi:hypothetical protein
VSTVLEPEPANSAAVAVEYSSGDLNLYYREDEAADIINQAMRGKAQRHLTSQNMGE